MALSGHTGTVSLGTGGELCAKNWTVSIERERLDSTSSCAEDAGWREFILGLKNVTGTVESDVKRIVDPAASVAVELSNDDITISGNALVNFSGSSEVDGMISYSYDLQFTGAVTASVAVPD
jgi:hypothetical protein